MLELMLPSLKYGESFKKAAQEYKKYPSPYDLGQIKRLVEGLSTGFDSYLKEYIEKAEKNRDAKNIPEGKVPMTTFWLINDGKCVGVFDVRHYLTDSLKLKGGNIGYEICPSERGKGMAKAGLRLLLNYCREILELEKVLITCDISNEASYKTISALRREYGGFEDTPSFVDGKTERRVWVLTNKA